MIEKSNVYAPGAYRHLLEILKQEGYRFAAFREIFSRDDAQKVVYLRHDIDYSPVWALSFARINAELGVSGTFFFQLRSPIYNLLAYQTLSVLNEIDGLGQSLALHLTVDRVVPPDDRALAAQITADFQATKQFVPGLQSVFSWHNPSLAPELVQRGLDLVVPGMTNAYSRYFQETVKYYSDSNLRHSVDDLQKIILKEEPQLQLLLHPFQWMAQGRNMQEVLANTWVQVIREREREFLTNHIYRGLFPSGMPDQWLGHLSTCLASYRAPLKSSAR